MGTEVQKRTPAQELVARIREADYQSELAMALPESVSQKRFTRAAATALLSNPDIAKADASSVLRALLRCAQDGLLPDGQQAAIVNYGGRDGSKPQAQYMPMIGGLIKVAAKAGYALRAYVVYSNDAFDWALGADPYVNHKPAALGEDRGTMIGAYAVATSFLGEAPLERYIEVMDKAEVDKTRKVSRASKGPWVDWYDEMARKTVARRLFKQLPLRDVDEATERLVRGFDADVELGQHEYSEEEVAALEAAQVPRVDPDPATARKDSAAPHEGENGDDTTTTPPGGEPEGAAEQDQLPVGETARKGEPGA